VGGASEWEGLVNGRGQCMGTSVRGLPLGAIVAVRHRGDGSQNVTGITLVTTLSGVADKTARNRYHRAPARGRLTRRVR
jgi:hypothetical protein